MKNALIRFGFRAAAVASVATLMGTHAASAAFFNNAFINAFATTSVFATKTTTALSTNALSQTSIGPSNQSAGVVGGATAVGTQVINAGASNTVVISQQ